MLLEDTGALVGLMIALFGVLMAHFTGEPRWDAAGSLAIGILLVVIALFLAQRDGEPPARRSRDHPRTSTR